MLKMVERRDEGTWASDDTGELVHLSGWLPEDFLLSEKHKSLLPHALLLIGKDDLLLEASEAGTWLVLVVP